MLFDPKRSAEPCWVVGPLDAVLAVLAAVPSSGRRGRATVRAGEIAKEKENEQLKEPLLLDRPQILLMPKGQRGGAPLSIRI